MVWTLETSRGRESAKIAPIAARYLQGTVLDIGCGTEKVWPGVIGVDNGHHFGRAAADIQCDATNLKMFADNSVDAVFSSHVLEHFPRDKVAYVLNEWSRVVRVGGHVVLYVPSALSYPKCGEDGANPDHKWDIYPGDIEAYFDTQIDGTWSMLEGEERYDTDEYSLFYVFRKEGPDTTLPFQDNRWQRNPDGKKRCLLIRYGAIGDILQSASVFAGIKRQGYHLTVNCTDAAYEIIKHDPNVDDFIIQVKDFVPNTELGPYTQKLATRYDRVVNHCESIEGGLLQIPGRVQHGYSHSVRKKMYGGVNYIERLHEIAGTPFESKVKFYAIEAETQQAKQTVDAFDAPVVMFVLHGTSYHKIYPWTQILVAWITTKTPMHVVLMGDGGDGKAIQGALLEYAHNNLTTEQCTRIHGWCGTLDIRNAIAIAQQMDCVVGPETGILNAVSHEQMPKVVWLSHSSRVNLTRDWINTSALTPGPKCPCYPCHQLHYTWEFCNKSTETNAALCASEISPEDTYKAIMHRLEPWFRKSKKWTGLHSQVTKQLPVVSRSGLMTVGYKAQPRL